MNANNVNNIIITDENTLPFSAWLAGYDAIDACTDAEVVTINAARAMHVHCKAEGYPITLRLAITHARRMVAE